MRSFLVNPFEIAMGRLFLAPWAKGNPGVYFTGDQDVISCDYTQSLIEISNSEHGNVIFSLCPQKKNNFFLAHNLSGSMSAM